MKTFLKFMLIISVFNYSNECNSQNSERESVTVTLDLKPILQLEMSSQDQIDFVFDKENDGLALIYTNLIDDYSDYVIEELGLELDPNLKK